MLKTGQVPHHFFNETPIYTAISGASQTGPNLFWIQAALMYAKVTGDDQWLSEHIESIEQATNYLIDMYDPIYMMIRAPGPLWIDTLIRENYTSDTNAVMVKMLKELANAEQYLGNTEVIECYSLTLRVLLTI